VSPYRTNWGHEVQAPIQIRVPAKMANCTDESAYWRLIAGEFEELARTCVFCNFTAKHRGSLRRHMVKMHNLKH
jgi:hypothetical protein